MRVETGAMDLATITVTYQPDLPLVASQLRQLPPGAWKLLVDNGSRAELREGLRRIAVDDERVILIENEDNLGLAAALNQGAARAAQPPCSASLLLLLDQDTEPGEGAVEALVAAREALRLRDPRLGCVGPALLDVDTGVEHGFHQARGWRWTRRLPRSAEPLRVDNLNGSGTLVATELFLSLGGLASDFFIDHVDTEWAFRVLASGHALYGVPGVRFRHRMGVRGMRYWLFGWRVWPYRSPLRHYFLFRNSVRLLRAGYVPAVWKAWAPVKLALTAIAHGLFDPERREQLRQMARGIADGRAGAAPPGATANP
jgi:rhamnosyltransferase